MRREKEKEKDEWSDNVAIILRKPKRCETCRKNDLGLGDWIEAAVFKMEQQDSFIIKSNRINKSTLETLVRMLKIIGVDEIQRRTEMKTLKHFRTGNEFTTEIVAVKFEKMPALKGRQFEL